MNWGIIGHEWAVHILSKHIANHCVRHAYLITGPQGVGRRTLALRLAQSLNCTQPGESGSACLICPSCQQIERMEHPDLAVIAAPPGGNQIRIEQIRELQRSIYLTPYVGKYRIVLILRFEEANLHAANALLKTLEEPPERVVLILTAESQEVLLPTIVSRCEIISLRPVGINMLCHGLQQHFNASEEQAKFLAHISAGHPGIAIKFLQTPTELEKRKRIIDEFISLLRSNLVERLAFIEKQYKEKAKAMAALEVWQSFYRDLLLTSSRTSSPTINVDYGETMSNFVRKLDLHKTYQTVSQIKRTQSLIEQNVNPRLAMDNLVINLPYF